MTLRMLQSDLSYMPTLRLRIPSSTVILLAAVQMIACGSVAYRGSLKGSGDSVRMALAADVAEDVPEEDTRHVRVYTADNLPPGLRIVTGLDGRRTLLVDTKRYDFAAELQATAHPWTGLAPYTFYPYNERWRRWVCWWQTPLQWTFIFIYWNIVPT
ncbi:hypothetical protein HUU05_20865, partial [candidate division KSB1 bacterium]|nr:hypothetical protein [candidate division KSB1 bacterium]